MVMVEDGRGAGLNEHLVEKKYTFADFLDKILGLDMISMVFRQSVICMPKLLLSSNIFEKCLMS